jgi:hypothetical protein
MCTILIRHGGAELGSINKVQLDKYLILLLIIMMIFNQETMPLIGQRNRDQQSQQPVKKVSQLDDLIKLKEKKFVPVKGLLRYSVTK